MRKYLDTPKIDYILTHLKFRCDFPDELKQKIVFIKQEDIVDIPVNSLVFPLSKQGYELDYQIDSIPIFYPIFLEDKQHSFKKNGSLVFTHDIFKQIFCLQTLYYEQGIKEKDKLGRIKPEATLNFKLNLLNRPIVDYLFQLLVDALEAYCLQYSIPFRRIKLLSKHTLLLSHDVDRLETYSFYNTVNSFKNLLLSPSVKRVKEAGECFVKYFHLQKRDNPLWDFPLMRDIEQEFKLKSTYYFLNKGKLHQDAYYSLKSSRISDLINEIQSDENEIGLHLTIAANRNKLILSQNLDKLQQVSKDKVLGVRSHWLRFEPTLTPDILAELGIKYDSSVGHYSQEGFRAATCLPYKLFSFSQNKMLDIWELPLIYMDCMILDYQNISSEEAIQKLSQLLNEVIKFHGVFTLLWHNGNFAKAQPFNRHEFYRNLLKMILKSQPLNTTASSLIEALEERK